MLYTLRRALLTSQHPTAKALRGFVKRVRTFALPTPRPIIKPVLALFVAVRTAYYTLLRICVCEPLFKGYCSRYGRNLRTGAFVHWVDGIGDIEVGDDAYLYGKSAFIFSTLNETPPKLIIGDRANFGHGCIFRVAERVEIGDDCILAADIFIFDNGGRPIDPDLRRRRAGYEGHSVRPVKIGNNVWIGARATICPGVTIGDNSVVATGSVVMTNVAPNCLVSGNPARKVQDLSPAALAQARTATAS